MWAFETAAGPGQPGDGDGGQACNATTHARTQLQRRHAARLAWLESRGAYARHDTSAAQPGGRRPPSSITTHALTRTQKHRCSAASRRTPAGRLPSEACSPAHRRHARDAAPAARGCLGPGPLTWPRLQTCHLLCVTAFTRQQPRHAHSRRTAQDKRTPSLAQLPQQRAAVNTTLSRSSWARPGQAAAKHMAACIASLPDAPQTLHGQECRV